MGNLEMGKQEQYLYSFYQYSQLEYTFLVSVLLGRVIYGLKNDKLI